MIDKMGLTMKLGVAFGVQLVILMVLAILSYRAAVASDELSDEVERQVHEKELAMLADKAVEMQLAGLRGFLLTGKEERLKNLEDGRSLFKASTDKMGGLLATEEGKASLGQVQRVYTDYQDYLEHAIELRRADDTQKAVNLIFSSEVSDKRNELRKNTALIVATTDKLKKAAMDRQNASESSSKTLTLVVALTGLILGLVVATVTARSVASAMGRLLGLVQEIADNNLTVDDLEITSRDEIGQAGIALNKMKNNLHGVIQSIAASAQQVANTSEELNSTSQLITANSEETSAQADVVSRAAETVSQNLQTVATGAEEMGASIKEIAKNATEAAKVATSAVRVAETTTATVSKLGDSSTEIGKVIKVITSIAQQTNLLALNATIEAARAGEAGKGFAVVANEVKELAKETAKATEDISRKIEAIQTDTKAAVEAIHTISGVINQVNDISSTIATAVEEQNATTNEMSRNVSDAAQGSGEITNNISGVTEAAQGMTRGATDTQKASQQLVETSDQLRRLVEKFRTSTYATTDSTPAHSQSRAARASS